MRWERREGGTSLAGRSPLSWGPRKTPARAAITQSPRLRLVRSSATAAILVPVYLGAPAMVQDLHGEGLERSMHARAR